MSRCFPFPPPGFQPKAWPNDVNLILKEKKEKKHKRHKDKDKKNRSKRKEKEGSEGDHKENKKRKREDRDKKDKKKIKQISSDVEKNVDFLENQNGGELVTHSKTTDAIQNQGTFPKSGKTIRNDGGTPHNQTVQKITTVDKTEPSKMANGQSFNVDVRRFGNGNGEKRIKIEGGSCQVEKVEKGNDENGRNGYGTVFGEGGGCKNEDQSKYMKAKEMNGYRNIFYEGNGCKNDDQNKNTRALDREEREKMAQGKKEKIIKGSSDPNFLISANKPSKLVKSSQGKLINHKELNGFSHGARPSNTSRPALSCPVEKGGIFTNQKGIDKTSSPQSAINNVCQTPRNSAPDQVSVSINNHGLSNGPNGLNSSHLIIKKKTEPGPSTNTVANVKPVVNRADDKIHPLIEDGRTIHKTEYIKKLRTNGSVEGEIIKKKTEPGHSTNTVANAKPVVNGADDKIHPLIEDGRTIHKTEDIKKLRTNGSVEGGIIKKKTEPGHSTNTVANVKPVVNGADDKIHPLIEDGRTIHKTEDIKKLRTNGSVEGGKSSKASSANSIKSKKLKPPHPDLIYLNEILSVPRDVELPQCDDDQDWLFDCKERRPILASSPSQFTKQVWAEAIQLNSVDITALPYVIPY